MALTGGSGGGRSPSILAALFVGGAFLVIFVALRYRGGAGPGDDPTDHPTDQTGGAVDPAAQVVETIVATEAAVREVGSPLRVLALHLGNLRFPGRDARSALAERVEVNDLEPEPTLDHEHPELAVTHYDWHVLPETRAVAPDEAELWRPLLDTVDWFERTRFYVVRGEFLDDDRFAADVGLDAVARTRDGRRRVVHGDLDTVWRAVRGEDGERTGWRAERFVLRHLGLEDGRRRLFDESLDEIVSPSDARRLRRSIHEERVVDFFRMGSVALPKPEYGPSFMPDALGQHPALAVADVDGDGFEDLYVMERWGPNMLLHNRGDGTFSEDAARFGLDLPGVSTGAIFADFDNDGDQDLVLGRSLERSLYLCNEDGRFVDRSDLVATPLPAFVSSVSAADYDGDGLLDVYFSTYGQLGREVRDLDMAHRFLDDEEVAELERRTREAIRISLYRAAAGVPNLLIRNVGGGRFERAPDDRELAHYANTFQAVWADYDGDGDPDLYLSNDYAPDTLYRNDGAAGFVDVTEEAGGEAMLGFGMGATFGDYDNDGRLDLYASNMFSKAGRRITALVPGIDPLLKRLAQGNTLLHNEGGGFREVSGTSAPKIPVAKAGWSWGGQFVDVDNDAYLDLYVPSGNYTAPKEIATDVDL